MDLGRWEPEEGLPSICPGSSATDGVKRGQHPGSSSGAFGGRQTLELFISFPGVPGAGREEVSSLPGAVFALDISGFPFRPEGPRECRGQRAGLGQLAG